MSEVETKNEEIKVEKDSTLNLQSLMSNTEETPVNEEKEVLPIDEAIKNKQQGIVATDEEMKASQEEGAPLKNVFETPERDEDVKEKVNELNETTEKAKLVTIVRKPRNQGEDAEMMSEIDSVTVDENGNVIYYTSDNKYTPSDADYQILGHNSPDWSLGFQNNFTWKDFDLSVFVYARYGQMFAYDMLTSYDPKGIRNFPTYFNYWTENNPSNDFPAANANKGLEQYTGYYALRYVDGSFIKIKNITLGYSLPKSILKSAGIEKCRFYATITNPFVFAKSHLLKDYDPEMNGSLKYPLTKQFVFGVNVTF